MKIRILLLLLLLPYLIQAQNNEIYDLKDPGRDLSKCAKFFEMLNSKPPEVQFGLQADEEGNIYFILTDARWFDKFFSKSGDGIAVDIVTKKQFPCERGNTAFTSWASRGKLLPPVYSKDLKKYSMVDEQGFFISVVGTLPPGYAKEEYELNLSLIQNKYQCYYNVFYDIEQYKWDLLDMGMYMDSITFRSAFAGDSVSTFHVHTKRLKFIVPFEKNKAEFSSADVKPIYDSLNLTDYTITNINIRAYSSVEGSEERNLELQTKRAQSIVAALQTYQSPSITTHIDASENWVEFLNDISSGPYAYLSGLSKKEVKTKLEDKELSASLEPFLKNHRKAILLIDLEKKNELRKLTGDQLKDLFEKSIAEQNLLKAKEIQEAVFDKIRDQQLPLEFLKGLEVPKKDIFGMLLNNSTAFSSMMSPDEVYESLLAFQDLEDLMPNDGKIKYNIVALKFRAWIGGKTEIVDPVKFKGEIEALRKYKIPAQLITRMMVNYNIIMTEYGPKELCRKRQGPEIHLQQLQGRQTGKPGPGFPCPILRGLRKI